jgi:chemotaxis protein histidine kinase CheA
MLVPAMRKPKAQLIDPRDAGLRGLDLQRPLFDEQAIARADNALNARSESMEEWLDADVDRLQQARLAAERADWTLRALEAVEIAAHEVKGMGGTYGFPLATRLAASLCRLIETDAGKREAQRDPALVRAHVDALRAAVRERIRDDSHEIGRTLVRTLEAQVARLGVAPR